MQIVGLRLLLIDDLHDISRGAALAAMLVQLREIGSVLGLSLGCFATREIAYVLRQDDQLANRFELMTLPRWQIEDPDYWRRLALANSWSKNRYIPNKVDSSSTPPSRSWISAGCTMARCSRSSLSTKTCRLFPLFSFPHHSATDRCKPHFSALFTL